MIADADSAMSISLERSQENIPMPPVNGRGSLFSHPQNTKPQISIFEKWGFFIQSIPNNKKSPSKKNNIIEKYSEVNKHKFQAFSITLFKNHCN